MSDHIVSSFDKSMRVLAGGIQRMGVLVCDQLALAIGAIEERDLKLADRARRMDAEIDALCEETERGVISILATRNPVAVDLRATIAALQISRELERAGDLAKNIAKRSPVIFEQPPGPTDVAVVEMGRHSLRLLRDVASAYQANDADMCLEVWRSDDEIDARCNKIFETILENMSTGKANVGASMQMLFAAKNLERIGDHATNIAEAVHFILKGEKIEEMRPKGDATSTISTAGGSH